MIRIALPGSFWRKVSCECDFPLYSDSFWNKMEVPLGGHLPERRIPDAKGARYIWGTVRQSLLKESSL